MTMSDPFEIFFACLMMAFDHVLTAPLICGTMYMLRTTSMVKAEEVDLDCIVASNSMGLERALLSFLVIAAALFASGP
jgi:hypothetical protein